MAEFCLECFNKINHRNYTKNEVWLEYDLCEECGEIKPCVMELTPKPILLRLWDWVTEKYYDYKERKSYGNDRTADSGKD